MNVILNKQIKTINKGDVKTITPNTSGTEVAELFETSNVHHLPVVDENNEAIGIISLGDYRQLQHHFTRFNLGVSVKENEKFLKSLCAHEVMTPNPVCLDMQSTFGDAIDIFINNKIHSIIICNNKKVVGIITPVDILKYVVEPALLQ
jgi:acetoin utilization protein AcuB